MPETSGTSRAGRARRRVFLVDDHPIVRRGLVDLIENEADLAVAGEAGSAEEAIERIPAAAPDLVLLDLSLGSVLQGMEVIEKLRGTVPVLVSSMHDEAIYAERALRAGASGYVGKHESPETLLAAIRKVLAGDVAVSAELTHRLLKTTVRGPADGPDTARLSRREFEIFVMIGSGLGTREIAERLRVSAKTVETHRARIKHKLALTSGTDLLVAAVRFRLEDGGEGGERPRTAPTEAKRPIA